MPLFPLTAAAAVTVFALGSPQGSPCSPVSAAGSKHEVNILLVHLVWTPAPLISQTRCCKCFLTPLRKRPAVVTCSRKQTWRLRDIGLQLGTSRELMKKNYIGSRK